MSELSGPGPVLFMSRLVLIVFAMFLGSGRHVCRGTPSSSLCRLHGRGFVSFILLGCGTVGRAEAVCKGEIAIDALKTAPFILF